VFKFKSDAEVVDSTIKLHTYQTRPVTGGDNDYYPHNMIWNYNAKEIINNVEIDTTKMNPFTGDSLSHIPSLIDGVDVAPPGTGLFELPMPSGADFIVNSSRDTSYVNHNNVLEVDVHYNLINGDDIGTPAISGVWYMDMEQVGTTDSYLPLADVYTKYSYKTQDKYSSYWNGFLVVDNDSSIIVKQHISVDNESIVDKVIIEDLEGKLISESTPTDIENVTIDLSKGMYNIKIFCLSDPTTKYSLNNWSPYDSKYIEAGAGIRIVSSIDAVKIIDFDILIHSTTYENDNRASIIETGDGYKYVVVKEPSKTLIPGYFYDSSKSSYTKTDSELIRNIGHYKRKAITYTPSGYFIESYITGSKGSIVMSGNYLDRAGYTQDLTWNDGNTYPAGFENNDNSETYAQQYTYGNPINIEDTADNKGHLFYNTSENLPAFYTINYGTVDRYDPTVDRFLYKIRLKSEHKKNSPILESVKFTMNVDEEEVTT